MRIALSLLTAVISLGAAAPPPWETSSFPQDLSRNIEENVKMSLANLEKNINAGSIEEIFEQFGWLVAGSAPGGLLKLGKVKVTTGQYFTVAGTVRSGEYSLDAKAAQTWAKNIGAMSMAFLPKVGALGNLPGFVMVLASIAGAMDKAVHAEVYAKLEQDEICFRRQGRTYNDLCNNCRPYLLSSVLGKLHSCSNDVVVDRDAAADYNRARAFCGSAVLCDDYDGGGTRTIISKGHRYDPLRSFWCRSKDEQIGMLLVDKVGATLRNSLTTIDYDEFRKQLEGPCKELLGGNAQSKCPTRAEIQKANADFPPVSFCEPGKRPGKRPSEDVKYEHDPRDLNLFVDSETKMQYRQEGEAAGWTGKCGSYSNSSDGKLNHGCCGPFNFDGVFMKVKPEDGAGWCGSGFDKKVPENLRRIKVRVRYEAVERRHGLEGSAQE